MNLQSQLKHNTFNNVNLFSILNNLLRNICQNGHFVLVAVIYRIYRVYQELKSLLRYLIPELMLRQKRHIHVGPVGNGSVIMRF